MDDLHGENDLLGCFVNQSNPGLLGTRIELDPDRRNRFPVFALQDDREREPAKHRSLSL
jgi:hypothetical protein